jgi:hypothetical protein
MNALVIASPDSQVWQLLRLNPGAEDFSEEQVCKPGCSQDTRQMELLGLSSRLEDSLL